jgi:four helix bundle protein
LLAGGPGELRSQLERALVSTVANIAEGAGRATRADRRRHYAIARGSANEAGAALAIAELYVMHPHHAEMRSRLVRVVQMLNAMLR